MMWIPALAVLISGIVLLRRPRRPRSACPWCRRPLVFSSRTKFSQLHVFACGSTDKLPGEPKRSNQCRRSHD